MSIIQQYHEGYQYDVYDKHIGDFKKKDMPGGIIALGYVLWTTIIIWVPLQAGLKMFNLSLFKAEKPAYFPVWSNKRSIYNVKWKLLNTFKEEELRLEREMGDDDDDDFDQLEKMVMGKSIDDFKALRASRAQLSGGSPSPRNSTHDEIAVKVEEAGEGKKS